MNFELKPCPFCGNVHLSVLDYESRHRVECPFCGTRTGNYNSEQDAIDAWNRRVQPSFTPDELEEIFHRLIGHYPEMSDAGCSAFEKITHWRNR